MLLEILRFIRGSVSFSVSGKYPERFINITSRNRIRLWEVRRQESGFTASMYRSDYRRIRPLARGAGVKMQIRQKSGLPTYIFRYRERAGVLIGACAFIVAVFVMSLFIWSIDVEGLETVSQTQMLSDLREHGLYVGAFKPALDYQQMARDILLERHEIGWMAVNVTGSYACVEVKEEAPAPPVEDVYTPCNIKARSDGLILRIEALEGETLLTEGSGVVEGQLVVSGVKGDEQGAYRLVHADARVFARTTRRASFSMPQKVSNLQPDGEEAERKSLFLFGLRLPYRFDAVRTPYSVTDVCTDAPSPLDITLPVGAITEKVYALSPVEQDLNDDSAEELLMKQADLYELFTLADCTVEARDCQLSCEGGVYTLDVTYTCVEDIAYAQPIGTDENTDMTRYIVPTQPATEP